MRTICYSKKLFECGQYPNYQYTPKWDEIDKFYRGEETKNLSYYTFEEFSGLTKTLNLLVFVVGALFALIGKVMEFREMNRAQPLAP